MKEITCMCENTFEVDFPDSIDLEKEPQYIKNILDGSFMTVKCPQCGKLLKPEFPLKLSDKKRSIDISYIPEIERDTYLLGKLSYSLGKPSRVVIGYRELVEKISIYENSLDDRVIELLKYYLLTKAIESGASVERAKVFFQDKSLDTLVFHIEGIKKDEIAISKLTYEMYNKAAKDIEKKVKEEPFNKFLIPPYVSVNKIDLEK
jgi:hypothetical protein